MRYFCPHCGTTIQGSFGFGVANSERPQYLQPTGSERKFSLTEFTIEILSVDLIKPISYCSEVIRTGKHGLDAFQICAYICPVCDKLIVDLFQYNLELVNIKPVKPNNIFTLIPFGGERYVPLEVPDTIASDYKEASKIMDISLKGSSTLIRRCLQGTLRNAYPDCKSRTLKQEIDWVVNNTLLGETIKESLSILKNAGNFGAHPSDDGLTEIYELDKDDLVMCFEMLDELFDVLYVQPAKATERKNKLKQKLEDMNRKKGPANNSQVH